ncbi:MAG: hypothetical protein R6U17_04430 [Thermoplasmata archaeon]
MEEPVCSIEITRNNELLTAKVQSNKGRYVEYENEDIEYLMEMIYDDISMEIEEDYW